MSNNDKNPLANADAFDEESFLEDETNFDAGEMEVPGQETDRQLTKVAKSNVLITTDALGNKAYKLFLLDGADGKGRWEDFSEAEIDEMCRKLYEVWKEQSDDPDSVRFPDIYDVSEHFNKPERGYVRENKRHQRYLASRQDAFDSETIELGVACTALSVRAQAVFHRRNNRGKVVSNDPQAIFDEDFLGLSEAERNLYLENILKDKPEKWVEVLRLVHEYGYQGKEIAQILGITPARVSRILKKIREKIQKENLEP